MKLHFRVHALQRMFERKVTPAEVAQVLNHGDNIESYPNDTPYPTRLVLGSVGPRPLHIVVADHTETGETIIITVYEPDLGHWLPGFRLRTKGLS